MYIVLLYFEYRKKIFYLPNILRTISKPQTRRFVVFITLIKSIFIFHPRTRFGTEEKLSAIQKIIQAIPCDF